MLALVLTITLVGHTQESCLVLLLVLAVMDCSSDEHRPEWGEGLIVLNEDEPSVKGIFE